MVRLLASFLALAFFSPAAPAHQLEGEWQSDRERSIAFIEANVLLEPRTLKFLGSIMGRLRLTFTDGAIHSLLPDHQVEIEGKEHTVAGFDEVHPYTVLYESQSVVVIKSVAPVTGETEVVVFNFETPDVMWLYTGGSDKSFPDSHLREYFVRRRNEG